MSPDIRKVVPLAAALLAAPSAVADPGPHCLQTQNYELPTDYRADLSACINELNTAREDSNGWRGGLDGIEVRLDHNDPTPGVRDWNLCWGNVPENYVGGMQFYGARYAYGQEGDLTQVTTVPTIFQEKITQVCGEPIVTELPLTMDLSESMDANGTAVNAEVKKGRNEAEIRSSKTVRARALAEGSQNVFCAMTDMQTPQEAIEDIESERRYAAWKWQCNGENALMHPYPNDKTRKNLDKMEAPDSNLWTYDSMMICAAFPITHVDCESVTVPDGPKHFRSFMMSEDGTLVTYDCVGDPYATGANAAQCTTEK